MPGVKLSNKLIRMKIIQELAKIKAAYARIAELISQMDL